MATSTAGVVVSMVADTNGTKRKASTAYGEAGQSRSVKRRASKACQCCRARKVRCNVVEHGAPCTNCRLDDIDCVVTESRRKRKILPQNVEDRSLASLSKRLNREDGRRSSFREGNAAHSDSYHSDGSRQDEHIPHPLYRNHAHRVSSVGTPPPLFLHGISAKSLPNVFGQNISFEDNRSLENLKIPPAPQLPRPVPLWAKDFAPRVGQDDIAFLQRKKALDIPDTDLRNELLRCFVEFVFPFMPLFDLGDFLRSIEAGDGTKGKISLLLFQAVMFAGIAMVDIAHLRKAGYSSRREARKSFYQRARLLYDFDTDADRITLMQALLLLTFWYERPDDEKDTWHWIGSATSLAHTIGLNRNPLKSNASAKTQRLWKRIWWSCVIRDRVISMGLRRPTRIKAEECDVPMLTLEDFDLSPLPQNMTCMPQSCALVRDPTMLRTMALMCIEQAKFCLLISRVFVAQYSIPIQDSRGDTIVESGTATTLVPKQLDSATSEVKACHDELQEWIQQLPKELERDALLTTNITRATAPVVVNGCMLHLIYLTTLHALHRPQTGANIPSVTNASQDEIVKLSRENVAIATTDATNITRALLKADCVRFLPTYGVTALMPPSVTNLTDLKSLSSKARTTALEGFYQCATALNRLRDCYASADHSMFMLEKAVRKAGIEVPLSLGHDSDSAKPLTFFVTSIDQLLDFCVRQGIVAPAPVSASAPFTVANSVHNHAATPPPDDMHDLSSISLTQILEHDADVAHRLSAFLAATPPDSKEDDTSRFADHHEDTAHEFDTFGYHLHNEANINHDFDSLINADSIEGTFGETSDAAFLEAAPFYISEGFTATGISGLLQTQGESSGFAYDMDWMTSPAHIQPLQEHPVEVEHAEDDDVEEESDSGTEDTEEQDVPQRVDDAGILEGDVIENA